jgi:shikimate kinase
MGQDKRRGNVILIGLMGAGKTTVGRALARKLGRTFFDSDHEIEARTGVKIPTIFEHEGEAGFREREAEVIDDLTQRDGIVLATGGGAAMRLENRERLKTRGTVVYLCAHPHDLWLRTRRDKNRPLLQTEDPRGRLEALFAVRDPIYREVAHCVMETGRPSINSLTASIITQLGLEDERLALEALQQARAVPSAAIDPSSDGAAASDSPASAVADGRVALGEALDPAREAHGDADENGGTPPRAVTEALPTSAIATTAAHTAQAPTSSKPTSTVPAAATAAMPSPPRVPVQASFPFDTDEHSADQPTPDTGVRSGS